MRTHKDNTICTLSDCPDCSMKTEKGKTALLDMHNNTAFAVNMIEKFQGEGMQMATTQESLDIFLKKATEKEREVYEKYKDKIQVLPPLL